MKLHIVHPGAHERSHTGIIAHEVATFCLGVVAWLAIIAAGWGLVALLIVLGRALFTLLGV